MPKLRHGSLFSGIGGFDLAAEWMGWENVFHCEWNDFGKKILKYYWPNAISYDDITKTDFTIHRGKIDILTGGFPCQPYSMAGKRKGKDDERHLWPEMLRAIREIQPRWIVGENVRGLTNWNGGMVFDEVCAQMEDIGYQVAPFFIPASGVGAPHRRERIWFIAHASDIRRNAREAKQSLSGYSTDGTKTDATDASNTGLERIKIGGSIGKSRSQQNELTSRCFRTNWSHFPSVSPICNGDDGISDRLDAITFSKWRTESIKGGGNAVVPKLVYTIFRTIDEYDRSTNPAAPDH